GERQDREHRDRAMLEHGAEGEAQILRQLVERPPGPQRADVLAQFRFVAEVAPRRIARFVLARPRLQALARLLLEMKLQLFAELGFLAPPPQPPGKPAKESHHCPSSPGF